MNAFSYVARRSLGLDGDQGYECAMAVRQVQAMEWNYLKILEWHAASRPRNTSIRSTSSSTTSTNTNRQNHRTMEDVNEYHHRRQHRHGHGNSRQIVPVWSMDLENLQQRYLLVGNASGACFIFDLEDLDAKAMVSSMMMRQPKQKQIQQQQHRSALWGNTHTNAAGAHASSFVHQNALSPNRHITLSTTTASSSILSPLESIPALTSVDTAKIEFDRNGDRLFQHGHQFGVTSVQWYPVDTGMFLTGSYDRTVKVWDTNEVKVVLQFNVGHKVHCAAMSSQMKSHALIGVGLGARDVRLCDIQTGASTHLLVGHREEVWSIAWSRHNEFHLVTGSQDGTIRVWDIRRSGSTACWMNLDAEGNPGHIAQQSHPQSQSKQSHHHLLLLPHPRDMPDDFSTSPRHQRLSRKRPRGKATTNVQEDDMTPAFISTSQVNAKAKVKAHEGGVTALAFTPDNRFLLSSGTDDRLRLWNATTGEHQFVNYLGISNNRRKGTSMAVAQEWMSDSTMVFHPNEEGDIKAFRVQSSDGQAIQSLQQHLGPVTCCVYRSRTQELYSGGDDGMILVWTPPDPTIDHERKARSKVWEGNRLASFVAHEEEEEKTVDVETADAWSDEENAFVPPILRTL